MSCERPHDPRWCGVDRSETGAQAGKGDRLQALHDPAQDVVEQVDLGLGVVPGSAHEQGRH
jgi:hypothetical protein